MSLFRFRRYLLAGLGLLALAASACESIAPTQPPVPANTPTPAATQAATPPDVPAGSATPTPQAQRAPTLTLWLPASLGSGPAYELFLQQLAEFSVGPDGVPVEVLLKSDTGAGGLFDLLRTASPIAPGILPDLIALNAPDLQTAARSGLLQPIGEQLPADIVADYYPFARDIDLVGDQLYGLVFAADVLHLAYNTRLVDTPPVTWTDVMTANHRYVFPLFDVERYISDDVLAQYLALGGRFTDADGQPMLDGAALEVHLDLLLAAQQRGALPDNVLALDDPGEAWASFLATGAAFASVRASEYLSTAESLPTIQFAPLPRLERPTPPIGRGWSLALVTRDQRRQTAALRLLQWIVTPANNGAWTQAAQMLPGRAASLAVWDQTQPYTGFLEEQLHTAVARPAVTVLKAVGPAYAKAIQDVLTGRATPEQAAQTAVAALTRTTP